MFRLVNGMRAVATILVAVTLLLAPLAVGAGAMASAASDPHASMTADEHCRTMPSLPGDDRERADETCCIAMCMGLAMEPGTRMADLTLPRVKAAFTAQGDRAGQSGGTPTPPPKLA